MSQSLEIDVVIGGGGVAGLAAAAALQQIGYSVAVIEPGLNDSRRLAGEVLHPPGVEGLSELGFDNLMLTPAVSLEGFSLWSGGKATTLPYSEVKAHRSSGLCLPHELIRERMWQAVNLLPNVSLERDYRVVAIDQSNSSHVLVDVANGCKTKRYRCRMLVAADGSSSRLARLAGIRVHSRRVSTIVGYRLSTSNMPSGKFGHVFLGARTPILLYPIGGGQARILFDVPYEAGHRAEIADYAAMAEVLPDGLRPEVEEAIATQSRMSLLVQAVNPDRAATGRVVLVGDAGGSCHPLTATGMTMCISDALMLRTSMQKYLGVVPAALQLYQRQRRWPQATRLMLADTVRDVFSGETVDMRVALRGVLLRLSGRAQRSATLSLLSTADSRPLSLLRQFAMAMLHGYAAHIRKPLPNDDAISSMHIASRLASVLMCRMGCLFGPPLRSIGMRIGLIRHTATRLDDDKVAPVVRR